MSERIAPEIHYTSQKRKIDLSVKTDNGIYKPAEDTFLLLDALDEVEELSEKVLELGTGTGIIAIYCAKRGSEVIATDINEKALALAEENARLNGVDGRIKLVESNLFENVKGRFETIVFNPPYLPEEEPRDIALDGGEKGYELSKLFLKDLGKHLKQGGSCYLLLSSLDLPERLLESYRHKILAEKSFFFEKLYVFEIL
ncbi:MAG: HemK2/MTQ2 family protein methyltransferase [Candidatus Thermoplasmatota archaeon]|nr:HemK2/MTQ2 family protein methyltransferase [Candidatus Thermoplasmatota archaeon]